MVVKFIGGSQDGVEREIAQPLPVWRVPVPPKVSPDWSAQGQGFDPSTAPDITVEEYRLYHFDATHKFYIHSSVDARARLEVEALDWDLEDQP